SIGICRERGKRSRETHHRNGGEESTPVRRAPFHPDQHLRLGIIGPGIQTLTPRSPRVNVRAVQSLISSDWLAAPAERGSHPTQLQMEIRLFMKSETAISPLTGFTAAPRGLDSWPFPEPRVPNESTAAPLVVSST